MWKVYFQKEQRLCHCYFELKTIIAKPYNINSLEYFDLEVFQAIIKQ